VRHDEDHDSRGSSAAEPLTSASEMRTRIFRSHAKSPASPACSTTSSLVAEQFRSRQVTAGYALVLDGGGARRSGVLLCSLEQATHIILIRRRRSIGATKGLLTERPFSAPPPLPFLHPRQPVSADP
jgi:hypothetical protein